MEIIKDTIIRNRWHRGFADNETFKYRSDLKKYMPTKTTEVAKKDTIIIHGTGGGGTLNYVRNGGRRELYKKGVALFHYLIQQDGTVYEIIDPERWVFHSSSWLEDRHTIGIEIVNPHANNEAKYTKNQYESLFDLIFDELFDRFNIKVIASHKRYMQKHDKKRQPKNCPGNFNWALLEEEMQASGYTYVHNEKFESYWGIRKDGSEL